MLDAQEMRRRWSDKTSATFSRSEFRQEFTYGPENRELEIDFDNCRSIVFLDGDGRRGGEDLLLMARGSGHVTLPAGVQVRVVQGSVKLAPQPPAGDSVVGSTYGGSGGHRAPPPTRASSYAGSSISSASAYRSAQGGSQATAYRPQNPSPPRSSAGFRATGSHVGTYVQARRTPLPPSRVGGADDWEVQEEADGDWDIDTRSIAPSESVSSVGSRNRGARDFY